ncbi:MAG TPA: hypothetical protein VFZ65_14920 [Planctomycetota bacterium]|nr:hypothetical protein [Planctomycetota bacterium]
MHTPRSLFLITLSMGAATVAAQTWTQQNPAPFPNTLQRRAGGIAWHPLAGGLVMYGGLQAGPTLTLNDTWLWDGGTWTQLTTTTTPPPRWGHHMVYDSRRGRIVAFGGRSPTTTTVANDTWEFDGVDWQQVFPLASPSARAFYGMAYDERRGKTIVFGTQSGTGAAGQQTWEYDGTTWTQAITATVPPGVESPAMAYDKGRGVTVMFGGFNGTPPGTDYRTTWEYDGVDWTLKATTNSPLTGYRASMCYDDLRGRLVLYGGYANAQAQQLVWEYDGNDWTQVLTGGPGRVTEGYMAWLPTTLETLYFGGSGPTIAGVGNNETWLYSGAYTAIAAPYGHGCPTSAGIPALAATTTPVLGTIYQLTLTGAPAVSIGLVVHGLDNLQFAPGIALPLDLGIAGIAGCGLEVRPDATIVELPAGGTFTHLFPVPNDLLLTGTGLFTQALVIDSAAPNGFAGMSNAVHAVLGL